MTKMKSTVLSHANVINKCISRPILRHLQLENILKNNSNYKKRNEINNKAKAKYKYIANK